MCVFLFPKQSERWKISKIAVPPSPFLPSNFTYGFCCPRASARKNSPLKAKSLQTRNYSHLTPNVPPGEKRTYYPPGLGAQRLVPSGQTPLRGAGASGPTRDGASGGGMDASARANGCFDSYRREAWGRHRAFQIGSSGHVSSRVGTLRPIGRASLWPLVHPLGHPSGPALSTVLAHLCPGGQGMV